MEQTKKERLQSAGWRTGDAAEFLDLSDEEAAFVELKLALAGYLRQMRTQNDWTQEHVAHLVGSSQSRVAKMEAADSSVSIDLLIRALLKLGASRQQVGDVIVSG